MVVQFRTEKLDLDAFNEKHSEGAWACSVNNRLPGKMWLHGVAGKGAAPGRIAVNKSRGLVFFNGWLAHGRSEAFAGNI